MSTTTAEQVSFDASAHGSGSTGLPDGRPAGEPIAERLPAADGRADRAARARVAAARLSAEGVEGVILSWVDNAGLARVKTVPVRRLEHAAVWGVGAAPCFDVVLVDDSFTTSHHIGGPVGDLRLIPDLGRLTKLAGQPGWAWAPADRFDQDGSEHPGCQRRFAQRMIAAAAARGLELRAGIEIEWVVALAGPPSEPPVYPSHGPAYGFNRLVDLSDYLRDLLHALDEQGLPVLQLHPEYTTGQFEVSTAPEDPLGAADTSVLVRQTVRAVGARHGLRTSFAPAVEAGGVGNGGHLHLSLWRDGQNLGKGGPGPYGLTGENESFLAGVLAELPALLALGAPSPASYLRLVPQHWAGSFQCWGRENREAALRLIPGPAGEGAGSANAELKCFDLTANPYLLIGGVLAAGLAGIDACRSLPTEVPEDPATRPEGEIPRLPGSLAASLAEFRTSGLLREALGEPLFEAVGAVRQAELELFARHTPDELAAATRWRY
ncbi:glutamine synthetase [Kitasatospora sp. GP30]|uniref:glutamine synthetase family protein n=1 Tax=Kitasatospora sp. GP30 TaxID=3035084 RepID=UPI000C714581|nr:glutamine synthetase family protein [Kitasatospora sp. GP30]MDH6142094.1 glutamine synthetase [Kitasatospora sp. GP30]